jgi:hypothetical protein
VFQQNLFVYALWWWHAVETRAEERIVAFLLYICEAIVIYPIISTHIVGTAHWNRKLFARSWPMVKLALMKRDNTLQFVAVVTWNCMTTNLKATKLVVTHTPISRERLGKQARDVLARNNRRSSIGRQRSRKPPGYSWKWCFPRGPPRGSITKSE